jgi:MFS family permease
VASVSNGTAKPKQAYKFAIPFLGLLSAIQGSAPFLSSTALVDVTKDLGLKGGEIALAASIQTLAIAATVVTTGLLADRLGRKIVLMAAVIVGFAGLLVVAVSPAAIFYLLGQAIIGVGMGAVYGASFAYVRAVAPPGKLAASVGMYTATAGVVTVMLVFGSSSLVGINWRLAFVVYAIFTGLMFFLIPALLPKQPRISGTSLDVPGQLFLALGIVGLLYGVSHLGASLTSLTTLGPLIVGIVLLALFFIREARSSKAFYPVSLFRSPIFWAAIMAGLIYNLSLSIAFLQSTNLWQYITKVPSGEIALWQLPLNLFSIVGAVVFGRLIGKRLTNGSAILVGGLLVAVGFVYLASVRNAQSFWTFLPALVILGFSITATSIPFGNLILREAPADKLGPVSSSRTTIGQVFYSMGTALSTVTIDRLTNGGVTERLLQAGVQPDQISTATSAVSTFASTGKAPTTSLAQEALKDAIPSYTNGFGVVMLITAAIVVVAALVGFVLAKKDQDDAPQSNPDAAPAASATA